MGGSKLEIAQVNVVDPDTIYANQAEYEYEKVIEKIIEEKDFDLFLFVVTNILDSDSDVLSIGDKSENVEKAFFVTLKKNRALLKGVVSRKKQIVTNLDEVFQLSVANKNSIRCNFCYFLYLLICCFNIYLADFRSMFIFRSEKVVVPLIQAHERGRHRFRSVNQ